MEVSGVAGDWEFEGLLSGLDGLAILEGGVGLAGTVVGSLAAFADCLPD